MKCNLLIADSDIGYSDRVRCALSKNASIQNVDCAYDGDTAYRMAKTKRYEIIIMDPILPNRYGLRVLRDLDMGIYHPFVIINADFLSPSVIQSMEKADVQSALFKSDNLDSLMTVVEEGIEQMEEHTHRTEALEDAFRREVMRRMRAMNFSFRLSGSRYLSDAVALVMDSPRALYNLSGGVYATIAKWYHSDPSRVERCIRNAIRIADSDGSISRAIGCRATCKSCIEYFSSIHRCEREKEHDTP